MAREHVPKVCFFYTDISCVGKIDGSIFLVSGALAYVGMVRCGLPAAFM